MTKFGDRLKRERVQKWEAQYVNYKILKKKLKDIIHTQEVDAENAKLLELQRHVFQGLMDSEIAKVLAFYFTASTSLQNAVTEEYNGLIELNREVSELVLSGLDLSSRGAEALEQHLAKLLSLSQEVTDLFSYVSLNMTAVRKILKKFAKHFPPVAATEGFLTLRIDHPHEPGWSLLQGTYLPANISGDLDRMQSYVELVDAEARIKASYDLVASMPGMANFASLRARCLAEAAAVAEEMQLAQSQAERNAHLIAALTWSEVQAGIFSPAPADEQAIATPGGLALNCASALLYMANYCLVIPSVATLCARVGVNSSAVGVIMGCCDIAAMPGTVVYSFWTNTSFKHPLLASGSACLLGNLLYCLSYDTSSISLLIVARLVTGLGSARAVNRRYIADFVSKKDRFKASAAFVASGSVGIAAGPLLASFLTLAPSSRLGPLTLDSVSLGGWTMAAVWAAFILLIALRFEDPLVKCPRKTLAQTADEEKGSSADLTRPLVAPESSSSLATVDSEESEELADGKGGSSSTDSWRAAIPAMACCILLLFVAKIVQQGYLDSVPIFVEGYFGMSQAACGTLVAVLGLSLAPFSILLGRFFSRVSDRRLTLGALATAAAGCAALAVGVQVLPVYFAAGAVIYLGTSTLESAAMSLMSKAMHPSMAQGIFNAGLLATEAGTAGRFAGNIMLTAIGHLTGVTYYTEILSFGRALFGAFTLSVLFAVVWVARLYSRLRV